ncbi:peptidase S8 [Saccharothrix syringae]|uniref:Peptidase S8 n=1 Tax=Saccharothrix syringae TaxID=103733 RepID=A0A5Q0HCW9_SACSY|nr:peptidase S8 [Saccharothrix syringae]
MLVLGLAASLVNTPRAGAAPQPAPPVPATPGAQPHQVTLITGDRVVVAGTSLRSVVPGPGRERLAFHRFVRDGRLHVVPRDVAGPLAAGRLDLRLFDVTGLVDAGYDDTRRDTVPLIVTGTPATGLGAATALPAVGATAAQVAKAEAAATFQALLADPGVTKVWLDGVRRPALDRSTAQIGAPAAWQAGYTGEGVKVAVLDTGVDADHPDLRGREAAERNFTDDPDAVDRIGHGTHVAATIASNDAKYRGVAPGAALLDGKVCASSGMCQDSWILAAMQWAVEQGADVVNMSLGGTDTPGLDPLEQAVETLSRQTGALFVVAAGNSGSPGTIGSPGSADAALTVGAVDRQDGIAPFSSRGPRLGDGGPKPDITAPGVDIVAAKAAEGVLGDPVDDGHVAMSGTSMATPHVAGAAALLAQQHPDWTGARLKAALMASAAHNPALTAFDQGAGRVDSGRALTASVTADPPSLALGLHPWPHDDDTPVSKTFTLRNPGTAPVALDLTVDAEGPGGAPADLFTVSPARVTVPAGGEAAVTVTADTRVGAVDGPYSGAVVASGGGTRLRVPLGVDREVESYDATFEFVDAAGRPAVEPFGLLLGLDNGTIAFLEPEAGRAAVRLPVGEYFLVTEIPTDGRWALLAQPGLRVTGPTTVTADARTAEPVRITYPDAAARPQVGDVLFTRYEGGQPSFGIGSGYAGGIGGLSIGHLGPELPADRFGALLGEQATGTPVGTTPVTYRFSWLFRGRVPTGLTRAPARRELAEVRSELAPGPAGTAFRHAGFPVLAGGISGLGWEVDAKDRAIDYATPGPDVRWAWSALQVLGDAPQAVLDSPVRTPRPGRTYRERFNDPVFGPSLPATPFPYLARIGDTVDFSLPLFGDGRGNGGQSLVSSARTRLLRDGVEVGRTDYPGRVRTTVPPGAATYRVETEAVRAPGVSEFTSQVRGAWTFRSDTAPGDRYAPLPLTVVRFAPALDASGTAPAGRVLRVPLVVEQQEGAANGRVDRLRVEASFDDGRTWSAVPVAGRTALVRNPAGAGYASLRVSGSDRGGNTFEQTLVHAYKIG